MKRTLSLHREDALRAEAQGLHADGKSYWQIAAAMRISPSTARRWVMGGYGLHGDKHRTESRAYRYAERCREAHRLRADGLKPPAIADRMGVSLQSVYRYLNRSIQGEPA